MDTMRTIYRKIQGHPDLLVTVSDRSEMWREQFNRYWLQKALEIEREKLAELHRDHPMAPVTLTPFERVAARARRWWWSHFSPF